MSNMFTSSQPIQQTTTQSNAIPAWLTGASKNVAQNAQNLTPFSQYAGDNPYANLSPDQIRAVFEAGGTFGGPGSIIGQGVTGANALAGFQAPQINTGDVTANAAGYMSPYIQSVIDATNRQLDVNTGQATSALDNRLAAQHAFGGSRQGIADADLANQADIIKANTAAQLYSGGYSSALASAMQQAQANQAAGLQGAGIRLGGIQGLTALANALSGANTSGISNLLQAGGVQQQTGTNQGLFDFQKYLNQFQLPESILQAQAGALGSLPHSTTQTGTTTGTAYSNWLPQALGGAIAGAKLYSTSDRRVKRDIERIGELADGTPFYRFRYIGDDTPRVGLMSDEVDPAAVAVHPSGVEMVNYGKATERAARINAMRGPY